MAGLVRSRTQRGSGNGVGAETVGWFQHETERDQRAVIPNGVAWPPENASLPAVRGLVWHNGFRASLQTAGGDADLCLLGSGGARVRLEMRRPAGLANSLATNAALSGNLRHAGPAHDRHLAADAWHEASVFSPSIAEIRQGITRATKGGRPRVRPPHATDQYRALFDELRDVDGPVDVVDRAPGWELGARLRTGRLAVRVFPERSGLRLSRTVLTEAELSAAEDGPRAIGVLDAALRLNARIRFARLALRESDLVVEARIGRSLLHVGRLVETAQAIAIVCRAARLPLHLLAHREDVARCYVDLFHPPNGA